jgi:hypothetical protein
MLPGPSGLSRESHQQRKLGLVSEVPPLHTQGAARRLCCARGAPLKKAPLGSPALWWGREFHGYPPSPATGTRRVVLPKAGEDDRAHEKHR